MSEPLLTIPNHHTAFCGDPPIVTENDPNTYIGYFENRYGEQWIFTSNQTTGESVLRGGDTGWNTAWPVVNGEVDGLNLNREEKLWLAACLAAVTLANLLDFKMTPTMRSSFRFVAILLIGFGIGSRAVADQSDTSKLPKGHAVIRAPAGDSEIVITTTSRLAGAIHSLTWEGQEFIDSFDHGRQLQSAANFDCGTKFTSETFNPTEAGSRRDGKGETSSSRLLHLVAIKDALQTTTQMAFWLAPGEKSAGHPAKNTEVLSNHLLTKRV